MKNTRFERYLPPSFSSNRKSSFRRSSRKTCNSNYRNKFSNDQNGSFSSKFLRKPNIKVTQTKDTKISPNIIVNNFPSLPSKVNTKPIVKQQETKTNKIEENVSKNPWNKKNTVQHIKKCYQKINDKKRMEKEKKRKSISEAISETNKKHSHSNMNFSKPSITRVPSYMKQKKLYTYEYDTDNSDFDNYDDEYMEWSSE